MDLDLSPSFWEGISAFAQGFVKKWKKVGIKSEQIWTLRWVRYFELDKAQRGKCKKFTGQNQNATMPDGERWNSPQYSSPDKIS